MTRQEQAEFDRRYGSHVVREIGADVANVIKPSDRQKAGLRKFLGKII